MGELMRDMGQTETMEPGDARALKIMAKSVYRELKNGGCSHSDVVTFTSAVLELVTSEIRENNETSS